MAHIVLIAGLKRSGKDHIASMLDVALTAKGKTVERMSFAEPMKQIIATTLGMSVEALENFKNNPDVYKLEVYSKEDEEVFHTTDLRNVLQQFGSEAMKPIFGDNVWQELLYSKALQSTADIVLVPDFRFPIEYKPFCTTIKIVNRELESADNHDSETSLKLFNFDYAIDNTGYKTVHSDIVKFVEGGFLDGTSPFRLKL